MLKKLFLGSALTLAATGAATAAPISGSFSLTSFGGSYVTGTSGSYTSTGATVANATGLDFGTVFGTTGNGFGTNGTALIGNAMGDFASLPQPTYASVADILLGAVANPYQSNPFISFGSASSIVVNFTDAAVSRNADASGIRVFGNATFTDGNAADTSIGTFNITTSTQNSNNVATMNFTFTGNTGTTAAAVPEPMSIALLGTGLVGLGIARRKRA